MDSHAPTHIQSAIDAGAASVKAQLISAASIAQGDSLVALVPAGYKAQDLSNLLLSPTRKKGTTVLTDAPSFIALVNELTIDGTKLYRHADLTQGIVKFKAVFNDTSAVAPGWADHIASYDCPRSVEWIKWKGSDGKQMSQETFAKFIEENAPDCHAPSSADMIEISRTIEAKKKVNFASGIRLDNGQNQITYEEEISGTAAKGRLELPELFTIVIPVFEGDAPYEISARLRYRIVDGGKLTIWYDLVRPHKIVEDAARILTKAIADGTGQRIYSSSF